MATPGEGASRDEPASAGTLDGIAALLQAAGAGDEQAWRTIVEMYARRVYALARSRLGGASGGVSAGVSGGVGGWQGRGGRLVSGHDAAEEVTQSVFVTVAAKLSSGAYTEQGRFESWLFRVAMNRIRDEVRRVRRHATPTDPEVIDAGGGVVGVRSDSGSGHVQGDSLAVLRSALEHLSDSDREVVELRHHAGMSFKQMADLLEEPLGTLLARHHRALRKLKDIITAAGATPSWLNDSTGSSS